MLPVSGTVPRRSESRAPVGGDLIADHDWHWIGLHLPECGDRPFRPAAGNIAASEIGILPQQANQYLVCDLVRFPVHERFHQPEIWGVLAKESTETDLAQFMTVEAVAADE